MERRIFVFVMMLSMAFPAGAQQGYWLFLADKDGMEMSPETAPNALALERRARNGFPAQHPTDLPLRPDYLAAASQLADSVLGQSRWFNAVAVRATPEQLEALRGLPFVVEVRPMALMAKPAGLPELATHPAEDPALESLWEVQLAKMGHERFRQEGIDGSGVRVAIFDGGFPQVDTHPAFEHLRREGRIVGTYDFVRDKANVYDFNSHGRMVLSNVAGIWQGRAMGLATGAEFLLARTEVNWEPFAEEVHWMEAVEWAEREGARIINSSLGYTYHRYFPDQMDGQQSLVSQAAEMAFEHGVLVVNSAGNDGDGDWEVIGAPADAPHALAIGGVDPHTLYHIDFSSYGPTADGRLKPDLSSFGHTVVAEDQELGDAFGTSFASPLVAGFAACLAQARPELDAAGLFEAMQHSGNLYPYYDYAHGYGVPTAERVFDDQGQSPDPTPIRARLENGWLVVDQLPLDTAAASFNQLVYYHLADPRTGYLHRYGVLETPYRDSEEPYSLHLPLREEELAGRIVRVHFQGRTYKLEL